MEQISSKDISVVIQGPVKEKYLIRCLKSVRRHLPNSEIIISAWNEDLSQYDAEIKINNNPIPPSQCSKVDGTLGNNLNRQLVSTLSGLKKSTRKYSLKMRGDVVLSGDKFLRYYTVFPNLRNEKFVFTRQKILTTNMFSRSPEKSRLLFHISDIVLFGLTADLIDYFDIPLQSNFDAEYFLSHKKESEKNILWSSRLLPEQYIMTEWLKKMNKSFVNSERKYYTFTEDDKNLFYDVFFSNFLLCDYSLLFFPQKKTLYLSDYLDCIQQDDFVSYFKNLLSDVEWVFPSDLHIDVQSSRSYIRMRKHFYKLIYQFRTSFSLKSFFSDLISLIYYFGSYTVEKIRQCTEFKRRAKN